MRSDPNTKNGFVGKKYASLTVFVIFVRPLIEKELYDYFSDVVYEELYDLLILKG